MVDIHSATAEIWRGKKKKDRRRNHRVKIMVIRFLSYNHGKNITTCALFYRAAIKNM